jgi:putative glutamine amidotransferase
MKPPNQPPVIGITRCSRLDDYVTSVERTGARARVLEVTESPRAVLKEVDGVLLTGGGDVDPVFYGEERHPSTEDAEPGRDEFEIDLARRAMADDVPMLAICRGAQVLNVAAGGTLVQDIPTGVESDLTHSVQEPKNAECHDINLTAGSRLANALGTRIDAECSCRVNSRHHQSVGRPGTGLVVSATAADGVIEGIEKPDHPFCIGVQWHPENFWATGEFAPLFEAFVQAATGRKANSQPPTSNSRGESFESSR